MKSSLDKVVVDARQLATRMRARDEAAEGLLGQASWVQSRLDAMRQYQDEVLSMSDQSHQSQVGAVGGPPLTTLVLGFTVENRELDELRGDNEELRCALDEHQAALELIMTKYRDQISSMMRSGDLSSDPSSTPTTDDPLSVSRMMDRLSQLSHMIRQTNSEGENHSAEMEAVVQQLLTENQGLRQLVSISRQHRVTVGPAVPTPSSPPPAPSSSTSAVPPSEPSIPRPEADGEEEDALAALNSVVEEGEGGGKSLSDDEDEEDSSSSASSTINLSSVSSRSSVSSVATVAAGSPSHSDDEESK